MTGIGDQRILERLASKYWGELRCVVPGAAPPETIEKMNGTYTRRLLRDARDAITLALSELENK